MPLAHPDAVTQICSHQKDVFYINGLRSLLNSNIKSIFGNRFLLAWNSEINHFADVIYYCLTTAGSLQTLGEEYTNIIQVDSSLTKTPSFSQRILMIMLHTALPYCLEKLLGYLEKKLMLNQISLLSENNQAKLFAAIPKLRLILITIHRLHLSIFYIKGLYFTIAKRFTDVNYVKYVVNAEHKDNSFSWLGKFSLIQAMLMLSLQLYNLCIELSSSSMSGFTNSFQNQLFDQSKSSLETEKQKCSLCLEVRRNTSLTPCGHLFCWACIQEWIKNKPECPLCRDELSPNQIVCLRNYT